MRKEYIVKLSEESFREILLVLLERLESLEDETNAR